MGNTIDSLAEVGLEHHFVKEPITDKETCRGEMEHISGDRPVRFAVSSMQGCRATMEDTHIMESSLNVKLRGREVLLRDHSLFGVFDGHGGDFTSHYIHLNLVRILTSRKEWIDYLALDIKTRSEAPGIDLLKAILKGSFLDIDSELYDIHSKRLSELQAEFRGEKSAVRQRSFISNDGENEARDPEENERTAAIEAYKRSNQQSRNKYYLDRSGSTSVIVLMTPTHIICSNAGDSRAILRKHEQAYPLSFDHKPSNSEELARINAAGGFVKMKRIDGDLAVSRGIGDFRYKINGHLPIEKQKVIPIPDIIVCPRQIEQDEYIILGCDGIWDVVDNASCSEIVQEIINNGESDIGNVCEKVLDICLEKESKDNMTICIVAFPQRQRQ